MVSEASVNRIYSKTPNNRPSKKQTTVGQWTDHLPSIEFTIELIHFKPPRNKHLSTPKNGHWSAPNVLLPIQNYLRKQTVKLYPLIVLYIVRMLVNRFCKDSNLSFILVLFLIVPAFLASVQQRRGPKMRPQVFNSLAGWAHIITPTGNIPNPDTSIFRTCSGGPFDCTGKWKFSVTK